MVDKLPDYFFEVAASSTGKYHSDTCCGLGGLVRHTKAAVMFANSLWSGENSGLKCFDFTQKEKDCIVTALILHDGYKHGLTDKTGYTAFDHPLVSADQVRNLGIEFSKQYTIEEKFSVSCAINLIADLISTHMGRWTTNKYAKDIVLPEPADKLSYFVHLCDYLASRSFLDFRFDKAGITNYNPENFTVEVDLTNEIADFISLCKEKIQSGVDRETIYAKIQEIAGVRNPNRITKPDVLSKVRQEVETLE